MANPYATNYTTETYNPTFNPYASQQTGNNASVIHQSTASFSTSPSDTLISNNSGSGLYNDNIEEEINSFYGDSNTTKKPSASYPIQQSPPTTQAQFNYNDYNSSNFSDRYASTQHANNEVTMSAGPPSTNTVGTAPPEIQQQLPSPDPKDSGLLKGSFIKDINSSLDKNIPAEVAAAVSNKHDTSEVQVGIGILTKPRLDRIFQVAGFICAAGFLVVSLWGFITMNDGSIPHGLLKFWLLVFGPLLALAEWGQRHVRSFALFLRYRAGRGAFIMFCGTLCIGVGGGVGIGIGVVEMVIGAIAVAVSIYLQIKKKQIIQAQLAQAQQNGVSQTV